MAVRDILSVPEDSRSVILAAGKVKKALTREQIIRNKKNTLLELIGILEEAFEYDDEHMFSVIRKINISKTSSKRPDELAEILLPCIVRYAETDEALMKCLKEYLY